MAKQKSTSKSSQGDQGKAAEQPAKDETQTQAAQPAGDATQAGNDDAGQQPAGGAQDQQAPDESGQPPEPAGPVEALRVTSKGQRFYRAGRRFTRTPRVIALDELDDDELEAIEAETMLIAERAEVAPDEVTG